MLDAQLRQDGPIPLDARIQCAAGELVALVGPSGAGKSTILRAMAGLTRVRHGKVLVAGECWQDSDRGIWLDARQRRLGIVFQSYALFPHLSVLDNVAEAVHELPRTERRNRATQTLARVHLAGLERRRPAQLSGGQQQRVSLARALVREPKVLLLDEPFASVDQATRERLYEELAELRSGLNIPVVLVTHSMIEAQLLADRMVVLRRGKTLQDGPPNDVLSRPNSEDVARLVGFGNLFETKVLGTDAARGIAWVAWGDGARVALDISRQVCAGEALRWGIAAGDVVILKAGRAPGEASQTVSTILEKATALGDSVHLTLRSLDSSLRLRAVVTKRFFERAETLTGQTVQVELPQDRVLTF
ncbi:ABC transporter ATP-binding protein [Variovorax sp. LARHSF232]